MNLRFGSSPFGTRPKRIHPVNSVSRRNDHRFRQPKEMTDMLYTIAVVLILLWLLGLVSAYTMSGFIHVLLVIAVILILVRIISGRKPV